MRTFVRIGVILLSAVFLGGCFLFGGPGIELVDVNRAMAIASHEAVYTYYFTGSVAGSQTGSGGPLSNTIPGTTSGTAEWSPSDVEGVPTGNIVFADFAVTSSEGDEYVINGTASLATPWDYETDFIASFDGDLSISVNGATAADVTLSVTYTFSVTGSNPYTLDVSASGEVNGEAAEGSFSVTFTK
jgi:hypothetical protein